MESRHGKKGRKKGKREGRGKVKERRKKAHAQQPSPTYVPWKHSLFSNFHCSGHLYPPILACMPFTTVDIRNNWSLFLKKASMGSWDLEMEDFILIGRMPLSQENQGLGSLKGGFAMGKTCNKDRTTTGSPCWHGFQISGSYTLPSLGSMSVTILDSCHLVSPVLTI